MPRENFTVLTIDTGTYSKITDLAFSNQVSRAEYVRQLVEGQYKNYPGNQGLIPKGLIPKKVIRRGKEIDFNDLKRSQQVATVIARLFGITIDTEKKGWQRFIWRRISSFVKRVDKMETEIKTLQRDMQELKTQLPSTQATD